MIETLQTLKHAGVTTLGAGRNHDEAARPVIHGLPAGEHLVISACAHESSGVPDGWGAFTQEPGVYLLPDLSDQTAVAVAAGVAEGKRAGSIAVVPIHWGDNWGYDVPRRHIGFAHRLVDGGVDTRVPLLPARPVVPFLSAGAGVYRATFESRSCTVPRFYQRRMMSESGEFRGRTFDDFVVSVGAGPTCSSHVTSPSRRRSQSCS